jgi:hypothetical protein
MKWFIKGILSISLLLTLSVTSFKSYSQTDWAPIGAKWHYKFEVPFDAIFGYVTLESVEDTVIDSKICRKINETWYYQNYKSPYILTKNKMGYIMYGYQGKVYNYYYDKFHLLYDFSLNAGDTLKAQLNTSITNDTVFSHYLIDSVDYVNFNGKNLKRQFTHNIDGNCPSPERWFYNGYFIENAGYNGWLLGSESIDIDGFGARLRCYSDSNVSFNLNTNISCDSIENPFKSIENEILDYLYILNPVSNELILKYTGSGSYNILIVNNMGVKMADFNQINNGQTMISTSLYPKGIYYLILFNDKTRLSKKFVKL